MSRFRRWIDEYRVLLFEVLMALLLLALCVPLALVVALVAHWAAKP